jgi:hypothetical protein
MRKKQHEAEFSDPPELTPVADAPPDDGGLLTIEDAGTVALDAGPVTDEGMPYAWIDGDHLVSVTGLKRVAVHVGGQTFYHVSDDPDGRWIYRRDQ